MSSAWGEHESLDATCMNCGKRLGVHFGDALDPRCSFPAYDSTPHYREYKCIYPELPTAEQTYELLRARDDETNSI